MKGVDSWIIDSAQALKGILVRGAPPTPIALQRLAVHNEATNASGIADSGRFV